MQTFKAEWSRTPVRIVEPDGEIYDYLPTPPHIGIPDILAAKLHDAPRAGTVFAYPFAARLLGDPLGAVLVYQRVDAFTEQAERAELARLLAKYPDVQD